MDGMVMPLTPKSPDQKRFARKARASLPDGTGSADGHAFVALHEPGRLSKSVVNQVDEAAIARQPGLLEHAEDQKYVLLIEGKEPLTMPKQGEPDMRGGRASLEAGIFKTEIDGNFAAENESKGESNPGYYNVSFLEGFRHLTKDFFTLYKNWRPTEAILVPALTCALTFLLSSSDVQGWVRHRTNPGRALLRVRSWSQRPRWGSAIDPHYPWSIIFIILLATLANDPDSIVRPSTIPWLCTPPLLTYVADEVYVRGGCFGWSIRPLCFDIAASLCNASVHAVLFRRLEESFHIGVLPRTIMLLVTVCWPKDQSLLDDISGKMRDSAPLSLLYPLKEVKSF